MFWHHLDEQKDTQRCCVPSKKEKEKEKEKKTHGWRLTIARTIGTQEACISPTAASMMAQRDGGDGG
jgi:hypothetical protein